MASMRGIGPDAAVLIHNTRIRRMDRDDLIGKPARCWAAAAFCWLNKAKVFLVGAGYVVLPGQVFRRIAHADISLGQFLKKGRIGHGVEAAHRNPRHRFDAGADERVAGIHLDGAGGDMDGLHG